MEVAPPLIGAWSCARVTNMKKGRLHRAAAPFRHLVFKYLMYLLDIVIPLPCADSTLHPLAEGRVRQQTFALVSPTLHY